MAGARLNHRYRVVRRLGEGSESAVFLVEDGAHGDARRALKVVTDLEPTLRERLAGEFRRLAGLRHPRLVRVHDLETVTAKAPGFALGTVFFTADFVDGVEPAEALLDPRTRTIRLLEIAEDIASALAHVHDAGLLHCDVKPSNILVRIDADSTEAFLLDLGLSAARGVSGRARGTLSFMSREALSGRPDPRTDLYALGASLYAAAAGMPPFSARDPSALVRSICEETPAPLEERAAWVPAEISTLVARLLQRQPEERHSDARVLLDDLARVREALGLPERQEPLTGDAAPTARRRGFLLPPRLIGRDEPLRTIAEAFRSPDVRLVRIVGSPGVGRRRLVRETIREHQLQATAGRAQPVEFLRGTASQIEAALRARADSSAKARPAPSEAAAALARWCDDVLELAARAARPPAAATAAGPVSALASAPRLALVLEDADRDERATALVRTIAAGHPAVRDAPLVWVSTAIADASATAPADPLGRVVDIVLSPLTEEEIRQLAASMLGRSVDPSWAAELTRATGGLPRFAVEAIRAAASRDGAEPPDAIAPGGLLAAADAEGLGALVVRRAAALEPEAAAILEAAAVHDGAATLSAIAYTIGEPVDEVSARAAVLDALGFLELAGEQVRLPSPMHVRALHSAVPSARKKSLHRAALAWSKEHGSPDPVAEARHLLVTGPSARAARACAQAGDLLMRSGQRRRALDMCRRAAELATGAAASEAYAVLAEVAISVGEYEEAVSAATRAARARNPEHRRRALLAQARAKQMAGDLDAAEKTLAKLHATDVGDDVAGPYARLLVARASYEAAARVAGPIESVKPRTWRQSNFPRGGALRLESAGLAALYCGDPTAAESAFSHLEEAARARGDRGLVGRALALRGMVAQTRGEIAKAAMLYAEAGGEARAAGDVHAAAVYDLNQATAHTERGRHGAALEALGAALVALRRLGDVPELAAVLYNRGVSLLALGEVAAAKRAAAQTLEVARAHGTPQMQLYGRLLEAEVARREGDLDRAATAYRAAMEHIEPTSRRDLLLTRLNLAEVLAELHDAAAHAVLESAESVAEAEGDRDRCLQTRARVALALGEGCGDLAPDLDAARDRMRASGRIDQAWRADVTAARIARTTGSDSRARKLARSAREQLAELLADTPESRRQGLLSDPDAAFLSTLESDLGVGAKATTVDRSGAATVQSRRAESHFRRLLALSRRLNSELRLAPLLDQVIDTVIELTAAERGFLLLFRPGSRTELEVVVARNFEQSTLEGEQVRVSRSIAERAARTGEVVLTVDAAFDARFGAAESVAAMKLRSVLAVPLRQKGRVTGTIYVDHRFRSAAFDDDEVELVRELADIAAVAIENARLVEEVKRRQEEIAALNERLEAEVVEKEAELASVKARLVSDRRAGLRHQYDAILGRAPSMLEMLRAIDRATESLLPVVVTGESGTGKELVARALHENGPRGDCPFVAVNCGAVPEQLLESELFGHTRGSFTGADRDRRGLFEVADGGTLFLDEVADTSLAMQAKLLRAAQEGEIRRVGQERSRRVDVRLIAATNRSLGDLVAEGRFREDLYYRLNVLEIRVPPLRERIEDIPELAAHILERMADGGPPTLTRAALARLSAYRWPGNVRELENEMARAAALGGEHIDVEALSSHIAATPPAPITAARDSLEIKPRVEELERTLVEEALRQTNGNQTAAAKLLGLSRYGLQKKLKRYGISGSL